VDIAVPAVVLTSILLPPADIHYLQHMTESDFRLTHNSYRLPLQHSDPLSRHTIILLLFLRDGPQKDFVSHVPVHNPTGPGRALISSPPSWLVHVPLSYSLDTPSPSLLHPEYRSSMSLQTTKRPH
jgi:hypothetical protein